MPDKYKSEMDADIDFLLSAKDLATRFRWSCAGEPLYHDPEEIYSAALFVIGRLAVKYNPAISSWGTYVHNFGHWAMVSELRRSGYSNPFTQSDSDSQHNF